MRRGPGGVSRLLKIALSTGDLSALDRGRVRAAGFEPAISSPPDWRNARLSYALMRPAAHEEAAPFTPLQRGGILGPIDECFIPVKPGGIHISVCRY